MKQAPDYTEKEVERILNCPSCRRILRQALRDAILYGPKFALRRARAAIRYTEKGSCE